jgi:4-amino-4-deoxy-L-arabinose transferase-like glycosyltransferase
MRFAVLFLYVMLALTYARSVPLFESSDEAAHFLNSHNLLVDRALPLIPTREQIAEETDLVRQWSIENHQPPLYYLIGAALISPTERQDIERYLRPNPLIFIRGVVEDNHHKWLSPLSPVGHTAAAIWMIRLYSLALSAGTLLLIYHAALLAFGSRGLALTAMLLVALMPTFLNIGSSVNNDNLVTFLYTAGVYLSLRMWRYGIRNIDLLLISLILAAVALTKITGLTLFGVVYGALLVGVVRERFSFRRAALVVGCSLFAAALLAGWWYLRNLSLYGDPLAAAATQTLWGREFAKPTESGDVVGEISRLWRSFWAMVGHLHNPVYGAAWVYVYVTMISVVGVFGILRTGGIKSRPYTSIRVDTVFLLAGVVLLSVFMIAIGTRSIDISYGRLLFPALVGFAPLMVYGWRNLVGRFAPLALMPLAVFALLFLLTTLPDAYPRLEVVEAVPDSATPVNIRTGDLTLLAYANETDTAAPGETVRFTLYLSGAHPDNPALYITLIDPITNEAVATESVYPGMTGTDELRSDTIYRAHFDVELDDLSQAVSPRQLRLQLGWQTALDTEYLPMTDANDAPINALLLSSATLVDEHYTVSTPQTIVEATFGEAIGLYGYDLERMDNTINLNLHWRTLKALPEEYVATVQLLDASGTLITQDDGEIEGYPSTSWREGAETGDTRRITFPPDTLPGEYRVYVGWYRLSDFARLPAVGEDVTNDLYPLPSVIIIE